MVEMKKISDEAVKQLKEKRDELLKFNQELTEANDMLQELVDKLTEATEQLISSTAKAARDRRGVPYTPKDFQDLIDEQKVIIEKLRQDIASAERELQELEELFG